MKLKPTSLLQPHHILGKGVVWCKSNNAAGQKVKKSANLGTIDNVSGTSFTDYLGGYQYNNDVLQFFPHAQGYVKHTVNPSNGASEFDYVYQYKDHLEGGALKKCKVYIFSERASLRMARINYTFDTATNTLKILEENNYYPFGLKHQENLQARSIRFLPSTIASNEWIKGVGFFEQPPMAALVPNSGYQYKYNGKEWQDELGLNMYSMDMRQYDPAIARWVVQDPVVHHSMSPYSAFDNNPVFWADPSGADSTSCATCDVHGRQTMVDGRYVPVSERTKSSDSGGDSGDSNQGVSNKLINFTFDNTKEKSNWTNNDDGTFSGVEGDNFFDIGFDQTKNQFVPIDVYSNNAFGQLLDAFAYALSSYNQRKTLYLDDIVQYFVKVEGYGDFKREFTYNGNSVFIHGQWFKNKENRMIFGAPSYFKDKYYNRGKKHGFDTSHEYVLWSRFYSNPGVIQDDNQKKILWIRTFHAPTFNKVMTLITEKMKKYD